MSEMACPHRAAASNDQIPRERIAVIMHTSAGRQKTSGGLSIHAFFFNLRHSYAKRDICCPFTAAADSVCSS